MNDLISRQDVFNEILRVSGYLDKDMITRLYVGLNMLPSTQPAHCEGCKHFGKWENEIEYGYPSPCTHCKRRVDDHYER